MVFNQMEHLVKWPMIFNKVWDDLLPYVFTFDLLTHLFT
jgi:hypothetical protein